MNPRSGSGALGIRMALGGLLIALSVPLVWAIVDGTADMVFGQADFTSSWDIVPVNKTTVTHPKFIALDTSGRLYIAEHGRNRVLFYKDYADTVADVIYGQTWWDQAIYGTSDTRLSSPAGIAIDTQGRMYIADEGNNRILINDAPTDSKFDHVLGQPTFRTGVKNNGGPSAYSFWLPLDIALDSANRLYVVDAGNSRVLRFNDLADTAADMVFGQPGFTDTRENNGGTGGNPTASSLNWPSGIAIDHKSGRLFIADEYNHRVLIFNDLSDTIADVVLGQPDFTSRVINYGGVSATSLAHPSDIALDTSGRIYVSDQLNNRILIYKDLADRSADYVIGQTNFSSSGSGVSASRFYFPIGLAIDSADRLFVADYWNNRVLVFDTVAAPITTTTTTTTISTTTTIAVTTTVPAGNSSGGSSDGGTSGSQCLVTRLGAPQPILAGLRRLRDALLPFAAGRLLAAGYYAFASM